MHKFKYIFLQRKEDRYFANGLIASLSILLLTVSFILICEILNPYNGQPIHSLKFSPITLATWDQGIPLLKHKKSTTQIQERFNMRKKWEDINVNIPAPISSQVDTIFGYPVKDPFRILENADDPKVNAWIRRKDSVSRLWLKDPDYEKISSSYDTFSNQETIDPPQWAGESLIYVKTSKKFPQPVLIKSNIDGDNETILLNPSDYSVNNDLIINEFAPSPSGNIIAIGITKVGENSANYIFLNKQNGKIYSDTLKNIRISKFPWVSDACLLYQGFELQQGKNIPTIKIHCIGTHERDELIYIAKSETLLRAEVSFNKKNAIITEGISYRDTYLFDLIDKPKSPHIILNGTKQNTSYTFVGNRGNKFWFLTTENADNGKIIEFDIKNLQSRLLIPESNMSIDQAHFFGGKLFITYLDRAKPIARIYDLNGSPLHEIKLPVGLPWSNYSSNWLGNTGSPFSDFVFHKNLGLSSSGTIYKIDLTRGTINPYFTVDTGLKDLSIITEQVIVRLPEGLDMPMFLTHREGIKLDGSNPVLLYVYGAYGWTEIPFINSKYAMFLKAGGIHAMPNLRGGGALGNSWYQDGRGVKKVNTINDALAAANWLVSNHYTQPGKLLIEGNSAGTIVAMAAVNKHPELFGGVVLEVPLSDMIRVLNFTGGLTWKSQFGDPTIEKDFRIIQSYSPYHNVKMTRYPPVFIAPGEIDKTAVPLHGYKLTAMLQYRSENNAPIIMRINWGADHNGGNAEKRRSERIDELIFYSRILGMNFEKD